MTRKDYVLITNVFQGTRPHPRNRDFMEQWEFTLRAMAGELARDNKAFQYERFIAECKAEKH